MGFFSKLGLRLRRVLGINLQANLRSVASETLSARTIPEDRELTDEERALINWLIVNGEPEAAFYKEQLRDLRVISRCGCGCPTIDLVVGRANSATTGPSRILADFVGSTVEGVQVGVTLHAREGKISELEIYELGEPVKSLPKLESLRSFGPP